MEGALYVAAVVVLVLAAVLLFVVGRKGPQEPAARAANYAGVAVYLAMAALLLAMSRGWPW